MKDQHTIIKGYRDLSQKEIDLIAEIKIHAENTATLISKVSELRDDQWAGLHNKLGDTIQGLDQEQISESRRCLALAKTNLQQGQMWFVRSVALPDSF